MLQSRTLLILGAGASKEAGFPLGLELRDQLTAMLSIVFSSDRQLSGDRVLGRYLQSLTQDDEAKALRLLEAARMVSRKLPQVPSIDALLSILSDPDAVAIAKAAICVAISRAEGDSLVNKGSEPGYDAKYFSKLSATWYGKFFELLHQRVPASALNMLFEELTVISFNYDRSFEEYLFRAVQNLYDLSSEDSASLVRNLQVIHPYGRIAPLDWEQRGGLKYGGIPSVERAEVAIKTFSEQIADDRLQTRMDEAIQNSERVIFLGFGFLEENMDVLDPGLQMRRKPLRGTAYGFSESNRDLVEDQLEGWLADLDMMEGHELRQPSVKLHDLTCERFIDQFSRFILS